MTSEIVDKAADVRPPAASLSIAPQLADKGFLRGIVDGLMSLLKGMKVTFHYLVRPSTVVTQQYPENRATLRMADRFRGQLALVLDENKYHKCIACHSCEKACPNGSLIVADRKGPITGKPEINHFVWRFDSCTFCNMCVLVCPTAALKMLPTFEASVYDQRLLVYNLNPYAGPAAPALLKVEDLEERKKLMEPRKIYEGALPLCGESMPGCPARLRGPVMTSPASSGAAVAGEKKC